MLRSERRRWDEDEPWDWTPTIDVHDNDLCQPIGFVRFGSPSPAAANSREFPAKEYRSMEADLALPEDFSMPPSDVAPIPLESSRDADTAADVAELVVPLAQRLWAFAERGWHMELGDLHDALISCGLATSGHATADEARRNPRITTGDPVLRLTRAGRAIMRL